MTSLLRHASDSYYGLLTKSVSHFYNVPVFGQDNLHEKGAAIFAANHLGALGPLNFIFSAKERVHPWIISEMTNFHQSAAYLKKDFVEPVLKFNSPVGDIISFLITRISVPMIDFMMPVPVYRRNTYGVLDDTFDLSLSLLKDSRKLLVCPEDPDGPVIDDLSGTKRFMKGCVRLGEKYFEETGNTLMFYPVAIWKTGLHVGEPIVINYEAENKQLERVRITRTLEKEVIRLYRAHNI